MGGDSKSPARPRREGHDEGASPARGHPRRRRPAGLWGSSPPRRHGWTHAWDHPTNQTTRSDVRGRGRVATRATLPQPSHARAPTFSRDCGCCRLRHSSTRPSGLPLPPRGVRVERGRESNGECTPARLGIVNRITAWCVHARSKSSPPIEMVFRVTSPVPGPGGGGGRESEEWNRSDHRVAEATETVNKVSALA